MATICSYMKSVKRRRTGKSSKSAPTKCSRRDSKPSPRGVFTNFPDEICYLIFNFSTLPALGMLSLTSKTLRDLILSYIYSRKGSERIIPVIQSLPDKCSHLDSKAYLVESTKCHIHYRNLGILMKRSTCLYSTKDRLKQVGSILDRLRGAHVVICNELGSDLAYSCYGEFLHTFIAGWEDEEKAKAFITIKGASLLEERIKNVMMLKHGECLGYERYIRVFCREIFLDKAETADLSFWLAQILKPWPMCFQARILFILYGPTDPETDDLLWEQMTLFPAINASEFTELSKIFKLILRDTKGHWNSDDVVSIFEEITAIPSDWDFANVASLMRMCGDVFCCEVLGNKAINGRISELSYLLFNIWQACTHDNQSQSNSKRQQEWFLVLVKQIMCLVKDTKDHQQILKNIFSCWEENVMDSVDDHRFGTDSQREEEEASIRQGLRNISDLTTVLLQEIVRSR